MAYSSLGFSLADLQVAGQAAPIASWGSTVTLKVTYQNTGASTIVEPLSLVPTNQIQNGPDGLPVPSYELPSSADASASSIAVYLVPAGRPVWRGIQIGNIDAPAIPQNSLDQFNTVLTLPSRPAGFPADGRYVIRLVANAYRTTLESSLRNNVSKPIPLQITSAAATPTLRAVTLDLPPSTQPGDTVAPYIQVANLGTAGIPAGTPVEVAFVASTTPDFNLGSSIVSIYTLTNGIPGVNSTPVSAVGPHSRRRLLASAAAARTSIITPNIVTPNNVVSIQGALATLPTSPGEYYVGVVIDPYNKLNLPNQPANRLELAQLVRIGGSLDPSGVVSTPKTGLFPNPPDGIAIGIV